MKTKTAKLYDWATEKANSKNTSLWIALIFSLEIFLFIPLDAILAFCCLQNKKKSFYYGVMAAVAATLSSVMGYFLGYFLWDIIGSYIVPCFLSLSFFEKISHHFQRYENWAVFLGALLPFPLKAITLCAGVFHLPFFPFIFWLAAARLLRFTLVASAATFWAEKVKAFLDQHFHSIILLVALKIVLGFLFFWVLAQ